MQLTYHGGHCCGMSHIHGMGSDINFQHPLTPARIPAGSLNVPDGYTNSRILGQAFPAETYRRRLTRLIREVRAFRLSGIIEIVLAGPTQREAWENLLFKHGFELVNEAVNSNSSNTLYVYHLNTGEVREPRLTKADKPEPEVKEPEPETKPEPTLDEVFVRVVEDWRL